jgi:hypothetical protein
MGLRVFARNAVARLPLIGRLYEEHRQYRTPFPPGHYLNPLNPYPSLTEISKGRKGSSRRVTPPPESSYGY